jgi:colanic acid/amylovoran biosynthesis glycosyltransferase
VKVTFCAYDNPTYVGGPNTWLRRLLPGLAQSGIDPELLILYELDPRACPFLQWAKTSGFRYRATDKRFTEEKISWILRAIAAEPPDVFVPNLVVPAHYAGRWIKAAGIPTVGVIHSDDEFYRDLLREFVFADGPYRLSAVVCVSQFLADEARRHSHETSIYCAPYGVPIPETPAAPPADRLRLVFAGRFSEAQKRISRVVDSFCAAVSSVPGTEAVLYGDGVDREQARQARERWPNDLPVWFGGRVDSADSAYEGLPIALLDGMACGLVPLTTPIRSGIPELLTSESTGLVVPDDLESFVGAVRRLRNDPDLWLRLSRAARSYVQDRFSTDAMVAQWASLLRDVHSRAGHRSPMGRPPKHYDLPPVRASLRVEDVRQPGVFWRLVLRGRSSLGRAARRAGLRT